MNSRIDTIEVEKRYFAKFGERVPVSVARGKGVYVWDENGDKYLDFIGGWGTVSIGHGSPVITKALYDQSKKIIQCPDSWKNYNPSRAKLLDILNKILPGNLRSIFFASSGCEANDAAIKLARKASGRTRVISTEGSFHGRTIGTMSATGNEVLRSRFKPLVGDFAFVPFNDIDALEKAFDNTIAAMIVEPIQGEGGVNIPDEGYLKRAAALCRKHGAFFIADEIQTGFFRTGRAFAVNYENVEPDIITMAKGIAGGFPFAAFAMSDLVMNNLSAGDHGGTYCGNPLGCAVSYSVIKYMIDHDIGSHVNKISRAALDILNGWKEEHWGSVITDIRGKGLLLAVELSDKNAAIKVKNRCFDNKLLLNVTHEKVIRIFPALTISMKEISAGLGILKKALKSL